MLSARAVSGVSLPPDRGSVPPEPEVGPAAVGPAAVGAAAGATVAGVVVVLVGVAP